MEQVLINMMEHILDDEDMRYISRLESKLEIDDDVYAMMNDIKLFFFKKGLKTGISMIDYCGKQS